MIQFPQYEKLTIQQQLRRNWRIMNQQWCISRSPIAHFYSRKIAQQHWHNRTKTTLKV